MEDFYRSTKSKDGYQYSCKECSTARQREPKTMEIRRRSAWLACLRKVGITEAEYNEMFEAQLGLCAICLKPENGIRLAVDHCHETGSIRGLLCKRCNMAIGLLGDCPDNAIRTYQYLKGKR